MSAAYTCRSYAARCCNDSSTAYRYISGGTIICAAYACAVGAALCRKRACAADSQRSDVFVCAVLLQTCIETGAFQSVHRAVRKGESNIARAVVCYCECRTAACVDINSCKCDVCISVFLYNYTVVCYLNAVSVSDSYSLVGKYSQNACCRRVGVINAVYQRFAAVCCADAEICAMHHLCERTVQVFVYFERISCLYGVNC